MPREISWDLETRMTPTAAKVRQVVLECGWDNAMKRWRWLGRRTLQMILERDAKGRPPAGRRTASWAPSATDFTNEIFFIHHDFTNNRLVNPL
jgi:hypothetical protein